MDADRDYRSEVLDLRCKIAGLLVDRALLRLGLALKAYSPDQPRVPAGSAEGGRWTSGRGGVGTSEGQPADDGTPSDPQVELAGDIPQNDTPEIPEERPPTSRERVGIMRWLSNNPTMLDLLIQPPLWVHQALPYIESDMDPPRTLQELQEAVASPQRGYDIHHIVEQTSAEQDGFPRSRIDASENLVRIPTMRHWDINAWFQTPNEDFGGTSPREYLRGRSWDERMTIGLYALERSGVLRR
jgi:hypothetical protein